LFLNFGAQPEPQRSRADFALEFFRVRRVAVLLFAFALVLDRLGYFVGPLQHSHRIV
jgi:hypothetical protein